MIAGAVCHQKAAACSAGNDLGWGYKVSGIRRMDSKIEQKTNHCIDLESMAKRWSQHSGLEPARLLGQSLIKG